jgi:Tfp pilus assembly protein PilF
MIAALAMAAVALGASADVCRPVEPAAVRDPSLAAAYLSVGEEEASAQRPGSAAAAFREALRHDPANLLARARWLSLCRDGDKEFDEAVRLMESGDHRAAAEKLQLLRLGSRDPAAALLEGICRYELNEDEAALAALEGAQNEPALADAVLLFRGLIALRAGRNDEAEQLFRQASSSADPRLQGDAVDLLRLSRDKSRLVLSIQLESGYDSNVSLAADGDPTKGKAGDGYGATAAGLLWRPFAKRGGYVGLSGEYRKQFSTGLFDLGVANARAGWIFGGDSTSFGFEYAFDYLALARESYLRAHRLSANLRKAFGSFSLAARYLIRKEEFLTHNEQDFSGYRQVAQLEGAWFFSPRASVAFGWRAGQDAAQLAVLSYREHGPVLSGTWLVAKPLRLGLETGGWWRPYHDAWTETGLIRSDRVLDAAFLADWLLSERWAIRSQVAFRRVVSNLPTFTFSKLTASVGVAYTAGLF